MKLQRYQIIEIDEKEIGINYTNIELKGSRPYLVLNPRGSNSQALCCPLIDANYHDGSRKSKHHNHIIFSYRKESYVLLDNIISVDLQQDWEFLNATNIFLNSKIKREVKYKLKKIFDLN